MAACVARAGHVVRAFDVAPERAQALAGNGVVAAGGARDAAVEADVLAVMVATPAQVEAVLFGDGGAARVLSAGTTVVIMATIGPATVASVAERLAGQGVDVVDAPVSGGVARAARGELVAMIGAPPAAVEAVRPLLEAIARRCAVVGEVPGDGQKVKLVNQLLCGVHIAAAAEALAFAEAQGLDAEATWEAIREGAASSFMLDDRGRRMLDGDFENVNSSLDIFVKDMGLVTETARSCSYPTPLASAAELLYVAGRRAGMGRLDDASVIDVLRGTTKEA
jgi:3-hydroxyisobutyrate dehydrogenase/putative dehydrogenase